MTAPQRIVYPNRTKLIVIAVAVLAIGAFYLAGTRAETDLDDDPVVSGVVGDDVSNAEEGVEALFPGRGDDSVLRQTTFGIDLLPGWTGELQLIRATGEAVDLPEDELTLVPELQRIFYQPLPDKTVERLDGGTNCVRATIWDQVRGRAGSERLVEWCFRVV